MSLGQKSLKILSILSFSLCCLGNVSQAKQVEVHDPVMAKEGDTYYVFSTGPGITYYQSKDLVNWQLSGRVFKDEPSWAQRVAPGFGGHLWAPDIIQKEGLYYLYYSVSAFGKNTSGIGVTVNKTLDPKAKDYLWIDQGIVLQSVPERDDWNAIDPAIIKDENNDYWMSFGSFWAGLKIVKLDSSLTRIAQPEEWHTIAARPRNAQSKIEGEKNGAIEAPYIFHKNDYYYLFVSFDKCCRAANSDYNVRVGRAKKVTGPYLDKNGNDMAQGAGSVLIKGNKDWPGLGHNAVYTFEGNDYLVLHAYEAADKGVQKLRILPMSWQNGWPVVDPAELNSRITHLHTNQE